MAVKVAGIPLLIAARCMHGSAKCHAAQDAGGFSPVLQGCGGDFTMASCFDWYAASAAVTAFRLYVKGVAKWPETGTFSYGSRLAMLYTAARRGAAAMRPPVLPGNAGKPWMIDGTEQLELKSYQSIGWSWWSLNRI